jgi:superfamily II DNA/RNA helicase
MSFEALNLKPMILKAVTNCGYTTPTAIQEQAIPVALQGVDLIATAQTGTGKTAAFVLPALQLLHDRSNLRGKGPRVLVLTPTRELAGQVTDAVRTYGRFMRVRTGVILGGVPYHEQMRLLSQPVDMIVGTPGRLIDHLKRGTLDLSRLELLILDEADRMLDMGFSDDVREIAAAAPQNRQTLLFTATMDKTMVGLAQSLMKDPQRIEITPEKVTHDHISQLLHVTDDLRHKKRILQHLIADPTVTRAIIFSATKLAAEELAQELHAQGHSVEALHGDMRQGARNKTITKMKRGGVRLLVATDVAARGLDVNGVSHVINFDLPKFAEDYVHRIGRTGRAGASGIAITFANANEAGYLQKIEHFTGRALDEEVIAGLEPTRILYRRGASSARPAAGKGNNRRSYGAKPYGNAAGKGSNGRPGTKFGKPASRRQEPVVEYRRKSVQP